MDPYIITTPAETSNTVSIIVFILVFLIIIAIGVGIYLFVTNTTVNSNSTTLTPNSRSVSTTSANGSISTSNNRSVSTSGSGNNNPSRPIQCPPCPPCPPPPTSQSMVQFVNQSNVMILLGASGPTPVLPREGTWELPPNGTLTIDIPSSWEGTNTGIGPRFWARTGCRYSVADNKAQCEIGDCGGLYNCFSGSTSLAGKAPVSLAEFCFNCGNGFSYYDVSLVDGYSLSVNIEPIGNTPTNPISPLDQFWSRTGLCNPGQDLRSICPANFTLRSSSLTSYIPGTPDNIIACFSNCGRYEYPVAPSAVCLPTDPGCTPWRKYCCQGPDYGRACSTDADCELDAACWNGTCQCRAFVLSLPCPNNVCTFPEAQPTPQLCSPSGPEACIGDDTVHRICPMAYSWPNDPQTFDTNAKAFRITFAPGGTSVPVSQSGSIPPCSTLPASFNYQTNLQVCSLSRGKYAGAKQNGPWDCNVDNTDTLGVLCSW